MHFGNDGKGQVYVEWDIGGGSLKRAWIQRRSGKRDWAETGRYLNMARVQTFNTAPKGPAIEFPVFSAEASDEYILSNFVDAICKSLHRPLPY